MNWPLKDKIRVRTSYCKRGELAIIEHSKAKEEILNRIDILDLVSEYVTLKKAGNTYKGLCPFHPEKTPSFHVNQGKQFFHCFGCHAGGDIFAFLMKMEGLSFPEALERLAKRCGVVLARDKGKGFEGKPSEKQKILQINQAAKAYYERHLWKAGPGLEYLRQRGLGDEFIKEFGLGFAPASWNNLLSELSQSYPVPLILKAGLICPRKNGTGYYDRFRNRVIFPIHNLYGDICGFGGRQINASEEGPKYLNSPETPAYSKGQILYGLYKAKRAIAQMKQAVIVEGYFDLLTLFYAGFRNVVATLGTALTTNQVRILKRYTNQVILVFDADIAGQNATQRGIELFLEQGIKVKVAILPSHKDPDGFLKEAGKEKFASVLEQAQPFIEFLLQTYKLIGGLTVEEKAQNAERIIPFLVKMRDPIELDGYVRYIAQRMGISEDALRQRLRQLSGPKKRTKPESFYRPQNLYFSDNRKSVEGLLIQLAFEVGAPSQTILENVKEADFKDPDLRALAGMIFDQWRQGMSIEPRGFLIEIKNERQKALISQLIVADETFEDSKQAIQDCIKRLQQDRIAEQLKGIQQKLDSETLSEDEMNLLLDEYRRLKMECICI